MHASKPEGEPLFPGASFASHMPFLRDETLLFCRADEPQEHTFVSEGTFWQRFERDPKFRAKFAHVERNQVISFRRWKLWQTGLKDRAMQRLKTGLPEEAVECSPSFYVADGTYYVSFIGGIPTSRSIAYSLYEMSGPSLDKLSQAELVVPAVRAGFLNSKYVGIAMGGCIYLRNRASDETARWTTSLRQVLSLNYRADNESALIVTCQQGEGTSVAFLVDTDTEVTAEVRGLKNAYKPTIDSDRVIYARRRDAQAENYELSREPLELKQPSSRVFERATSGPLVPRNMFRQLGEVR